jgi:glycolate oxidase iron-sulfur subunit
MRALLKAVLPRPALFGAAVKLGQLVRDPAALRAGRQAAAGASGRAPGRGRPSSGHPGACWRWPVACSRRWRPTSMRQRPVCSTGWVSRCSRRAKAGCCGAVRFHLNDQAAAQGRHAAQHRRLVAACRGRCRGHRRHRLGVWRTGPGLRPPAGRRCPDYAEKAARISEAALCRDPSEVLASEQAELQACWRPARGKKRGKLAFHSPCTLQHGLKIRGASKELLDVLAAGYELVRRSPTAICAVDRLAPTLSCSRNCRGADCATTSWPR